MLIGAVTAIALAVVVAVMLLEMVQLVEVMEWRPGAVEVRSFGDWPLPE